MPANSAPGENGKAGLYWYLPAMISVSKKLSAAAATRTTASPGPGDRVGQVGELEIVGRAGAGAEDGFHGGDYPDSDRAFWQSRRRHADCGSRRSDIGLHIPDFAHYFAILGVI